MVSNGIEIRAWQQRRRYLDAFDVACAHEIGAREAVMAGQDAQSIDDFDHAGVFSGANAGVDTRQNGRG